MEVRLLSTAHKANELLGKTGLLPLVTALQSDSTRGRINGLTKKSRSIIILTMATTLSKKELKELRKLQELQKKNLDSKQNTVKWVAISVSSLLFLILFVGAVILAKQKNNPSLPTGNISTSFTAQGHELMARKGTEVPATNSAETSKAAVTIVEYADFQCPACKQYNPIIKNLLGIYPDQVRLIYKHFPISTIHKNAIPAGVAAEAAGAQGKFFDYGSVLYDKQEEWSNLPNPTEKFVSYATELGLNIDQFKNDLKNKDFEKTIEEQRNEGIKNGVNSTPSFFINGQKIENPPDVTGFQKYIDPLLKKSEAPVPTEANSLPLQ